MSNQIKSKSAVAIAAGALVLVAALHTGTLEARERAAAGARGDGSARAARQAGAPGGSWTRTSERTRTDDGYTRNDRWQNADGKTASRDVTVARDKDAGTVTRSSEWTRFDGKSGNSQTVTTRTEDGFSRETNGTRANGEDFSRSVIKSCDKDAKSCTTTVNNNGGAGG